MVIAFFFLTVKGDLGKNSIFLLFEVLSDLIYVTW